MSRSNHDKPFYVDVGTSIVAVRCASNHDVVLQYDHSWRPSSIELARTACDRMNKEAEIGSPRRNCDVGTAEEQAARMRAFCAKNGLRRDGSYRCENCGLLHEFRCELTWAQMPYEEGDAK
jgi:hypothetical protein